MADIAILTSSLRLLVSFLWSMHPLSYTRGTSPTATESSQQLRLMSSCMRASISYVRHLFWKSTWVEEVELGSPVYSNLHSDVCTDKLKAVIDQSFWLLLIAGLYSVLSRSLDMTFRLTTMGSLRSTSATLPRLIGLTSGRSCFYEVIDLDGDDVTRRKVLTSHIYQEVNQTWPTDPSQWADY